MNLVDFANGKICSMNSCRVVTNWHRTQAELGWEDGNGEHVKDLVLKLTEKVTNGWTDCGLGSESELELHEYSPLDGPVVSWDLPNQLDELTGKTLQCAADGGTEVS